MCIRDSANINIYSFANEHVHCHPYANRYPDANSDQHTNGDWHASKPDADEYRDSDTNRDSLDLRRLHRRAHGTDYNRSEPARYANDKRLDQCADAHRHAWDGDWRAGKRQWLHLVQPADRCW